MLECSVNGAVVLGELLGDESGSMLRLTFTEEEKNAMNKALLRFVKEPLTYDLHEMVPDQDMQELAQDCENIRRELCE